MPETGLGGMPAGVALREALLSDLDAISELIRSASLPLDGLQEARMCVAECGNEVIGCSGLEIHGKAGLLRSVAIAHEWRGRGIGEALVRCVLAEAARLGLDSVVLLTTTAPDWFPRFGFNVIAREAVPVELLDSAEFRGACPSSAVIMALWR